MQTRDMDPNETIFSVPHLAKLICILFFCNNCDLYHWAMALMFELIVAFHFLSLEKGARVTGQWSARGGNSLNNLLALFCFSKRILWISIHLVLSATKGGQIKKKTRLFLHFSESAISAAIQIQLSAHANLGYKIIKGFGMKANCVSLLALPGKIVGFFIDLLLI